MLRYIDRMHCFSGAVATATTTASSNDFPTTCMPVGKSPEIIEIDTAGAPAR